jgi:hypothetical protein
LLYRLTHHASHRINRRHYYLTKSDADFVKTYVDGRREWF